jgi:hypothetical protein
LLPRFPRKQSFGQRLKAVALFGRGILRTMRVREKANRQERLGSEVIYYALTKFSS